MSDFRPDPKPEKREKPKPSYLKPKSAKQSADDRKYAEAAKEFIRGKYCPVTWQPATEVHHMKGRQGYGDRWAKENDIRLIHDQRYWLPVSREGHQRIENKPSWAKQQGYTLTRTDILT
jgi:hypothetical protein